MPLAAVLLLLAFGRAAGSYLNEWVIDMARFALARQRGQTQFLSAAHAPTAAADPSAAPPMDLPGTLAPLRILRAETGYGTHIGVVHHDRDDTWTAVCRVTSDGMGMVDDDTQGRDGRQLGRRGGRAVPGGRGPWSGSRSACGPSPGDPTALSQWHTANLTPGAPALAVQNAELMLAALSTSTQHETWVAVTMSGHQGPLRDPRGRRRRRRGVRGAVAAGAAAGVGSDAVRADGRGVAR